MFSKKFLLLSFLTGFFIFNSIAGESIEAVKSKMDSMDKIANSVKGGLDSMDIKIKQAGEKIKEMEEAKNAKPYYWKAIVGGAILGIGLAIWLKSRKKKK